ncbi:MAG: 50S ribosomal protein L6 [Gammaproteobacteria bacterium]
MTSRVASKPIQMPKGVEARLDKNIVIIKGVKGELSQPLAKGIQVEIQDQTLNVKADLKVEGAAAMGGTIRAILNNHVKGVSEGFTKKLKLIGVGYRVQVGKGDKGLHKAEFTLGKSHPDVYLAPAGIEFKSESQTDIEVIGSCRQMVGQVAADIRAFRPPEPYKGKGIRYIDEQIILKETKKK